MFIETQFVPHREHGELPLQRSISECFVGKLSLLIFGNSEVNTSYLQNTEFLELIWCYMDYSNIQVTRYTCLASNQSDLSN